MLTRNLIWRKPGAPRPTNEALLPNVRTTGRTHDALGRTREHTDEPRVFMQTWPPESFKIPKELYRYARQTPKGTCFVCQGEGHRGKECYWLVAVYLDTFVGSRALRENRTEIPDELKKAVQIHRNFLKFVRQYDWPLREACKMARQLYANEIPEDHTSSLGNYMEREIGRAHV